MAFPLTQIKHDLHNRPRHLAGLSSCVGEGPRQRESAFTPSPLSAGAGGGRGCGGSVGKQSLDVSLGPSGAHPDTTRRPSYLKVDGGKEGVEVREHFGLRYHHEGGCRGYGLRSCFRHDGDGTTEVPMPRTAQKGIENTPVGRTD